MTIHMCAPAVLPPLGQPNHFLLKYVLIFYYSRNFLRITYFGLTYAPSKLAFKSIFFPMYPNTLPPDLLVAMHKRIILRIVIRTIRISCLQMCIFVKREVLLLCEQFWLTPRVKWSHINPRTPKEKKPAECHKFAPVTADWACLRWERGEMWHCSQIWISSSYIIASRELGARLKSILGLFSPPRGI